MIEPERGERWRRMRDGRVCRVQLMQTIDSTSNLWVRYIFVSPALTPKGAKYARTRGRGLIVGRRARVWMPLSRFVEVFERELEA